MWQKSNYRYWGFSSLCKNSCHCSSSRRSTVSSLILKKRAYQYLQNLLLFIYLWSIVTPETKQQSVYLFLGIGIMFRQNAHHKYGDMFWMDSHKWAVSVSEHASSLYRDMIELDQVIATVQYTDIQWSVGLDKFRLAHHWQDILSLYCCLQIWHSTCNAPIYKKEGRSLHRTIGGLLWRIFFRFFGICVHF